jgi:MFS family permease
MSGPELAKAQGPIAVAAGLGVIIGPILDGILTGIGGTKLPFLAASAMAAMPAIAFTAMYKETLEVEDRKPFGLKGLLDCSPFGFVKMLNMSRAVKWLMVTSGIQAFSEGRTIT